MSATRNPPFHETHDELPRRLPRRQGNGVLREADTSLGPRPGLLEREATS
jgi:hypothetical protein